jgi:transposase
MAQAQMPDEFYEIAVHHLPPEEPVGPQGGRPATDHYTILRVIWYVLVTGIRWRDVPAELGCCGETARSRLRDWEEQGIWDRLHLDMLRLLRRDGQLEHETAIIDSTQVRAFGGGVKTGPSPVDRRKRGTKYTLMTDRNGVPLAIRIEGANRSDQREILPMIEEEFPHVGGKPGRPRLGPEEVYADAGYDSEATREVLRCLGMEPFIRRRNGAHGSGLGRVRWVVERSIAWIKGLRRLRVRYDRTEAVIHGWATLAMSIIAFRIWNDDLQLAT